jgi:hypothetical protein
VTVTDEFEYDPFSPAAMGDPLPIYRILRDHYPVYYSERYDTFFVSRFADIWDALSRTDNTFLATEGTVVTAWKEVPRPQKILVPAPMYHTNGFTTWAALSTRKPGRPPTAPGIDPAPRRSGPIIPFPSAASTGKALVTAIQDFG